MCGFSFIYFLHSLSPHLILHLLSKEQHYFILLKQDKSYFRNLWELMRDIKLLVLGILCASQFFRDHGLPLIWSNFWYIFFFFVLLLDKLNWIASKKFITKKNVSKILKNSSFNQRNLSTKGNIASIWNFKKLDQLTSGVTFTKL